MRIAPRCQWRRRDGLPPMSEVMSLPQSLRLRVATGAVAGVLVVASALLLEPAAVAVVAGAIALAGAWEWARLAGLHAPAARLVYLALVAVIAMALWAGGAAVARPVLAAATLWWIGCAIWLARGARPPAAAPAIRWGALALGALLLPAMVLGVAMLTSPTSAGRGILVYAVSLVWAADVGAYFVGRRCGRHALAPRISAGKTWEGFGGGLTAVLVYALLGGWLLGVPAAALGAWIALALLAGAVSVAGDLFESLLKRAAGVKDSGRLLPGHGGMLDRIDSLIAAVPVLALGLAVLVPELLP